MDFYENLKLSITTKNKELLQTLLNNEVDKQNLIENPLESLEIIFKNLNEDLQNTDIESIINDVIIKICSNGNPKEALCIILEYIDRMNTDYQFLTLLTPLRICLCRLDKNSKATFEMLKDGLNCAITHFKILPMAHYSGLEAEEIDVYIESSETQRLLRLSQSYLDFLTQLMREFKFEYEQKFEELIVINILLFFKESLIKLVFYSDRISSEESRKYSIKAFDLISNNIKCFHNFIKSIQVNSSNQIISCESIICLLYHIFILSKNEKYPRIFTWQYNFKFSLFSLTKCLKTSQDCHVLHICLKILQIFAAEIPKTTTYPIEYDAKLHLAFFRSLKISMTSNVNREIRGLAYQMFVDLYHLIDNYGRYCLIKQLLREVDHFGLKGQLLLMLKSEILEALDETIDQNNDQKRSKNRRKYFTGANSFEILRDCFVLPDANETDVVNESEWLMAALNLIYVIWHRDYNHKFIGLDVLMDDYADEFLEPLRQAIDLRQAHNNKEKQLLDQYNDKDPSTCDVPFTMMCPEAAFMDKESKIKYIDKCILALDMVKYQLIKVTDIIKK